MIESILNRLFKKKVIHNCEAQPYLHRWFLYRSARFGIFIHRFVRSDEDRCLHDHPWPFLVIPLWRGYIEHSECDELVPRCKTCNGLQIVGHPIAGQDWIPVEVCPGCKGAAPYRYHKVPCKRRVRPFLGIRLRPATYRHRVELIMSPNSFIDLAGIIHRVTAIPLPSWSLFIRFRKVRVWGFWKDGTFIDNVQWWRDMCGDTELETGE